MYFPVGYIAQNKNVGGKAADMQELECRVTD
jgi:hypothetical protein